MSLYRYVGNGPKYMVDPSGLAYYVDDEVDPERRMRRVGPGSIDRDGWRKNQELLRRRDDVSVNAGEPGFFEGLVPVLGEAKQAAVDIERGRYGWAAFHTGMAVVDATGLSALAKAGFKALARGGGKLPARERVTKR